MKRMLSGVGALVLGASLLGTLMVTDSAEAQLYRRSTIRYRDFDRDGIPDRRDRDIDNDGIRNSRDRNDYSPLRNRSRVRGWRSYYAPGRNRSRVRGWRNTYRVYDWDRDGIPNSRDRHPRNRWRR